MRRLLPLVALVFALAAAPASARDAGTITCMTNLGPGGSGLEVTLAAEAGGCPGPGEAIPAQWLIGKRPVGDGSGVASAKASGGPVIVTPAEVAVAPAAPAGTTASVAPASEPAVAPSPAAANAAIAKAVSASQAAVAASDPRGVVVSYRVPAVTDSASPPALAGGSSAWFLLLFAAAGALVLMARHARSARATA